MMKLKIVNQHLYFVQRMSVNGIQKDIIIDRLGKIQDYPDPISLSPEEFFRLVAKEATRLAAREEALRDENLISAQARPPEESAERKQLGYVFVKGILAFYDLKAVFNRIQRRYRIGYNLFDIFAYLVYTCVTDPSSVLAAYHKQHRYFGDFDMKEWDFYRALTIFEENREEILQALLKTSRCFSSGSSVYYVDATNLYAEVNLPDSDIVDSEGHIVREGLRKYGKSKEERHLPLVGVILLVDEKGFPLYYLVFPGNRNESRYLIPLIKEVKKNADFLRMIIVGDSGQNTAENIFYLVGTNDSTDENRDGYIFGQSVHRAKKEYKKWVLDPDGYAEEEVEDKRKKGQFWKVKNKSRYRLASITKQGSDGKSHSVETHQKQLAFYSEKRAKRDAATRERQVSRARDYSRYPGKLNEALRKVSSDYNSISSLNAETGEIGKELVIILVDDEKIQQNEKMEGYYSLVGSEEHLPNAFYLHAYKNKAVIEYQFRIMKHVLQARPFFMYTDEHIRAHFLVVFVSLVVMNVLAQTLDYKYSPEKIQKALFDFSCAHIESNRYLILDKSPVIQDLIKTFGLNFTSKIMTKKDILLNFAYDRLKKISPIDFTGTDRQD